MKAIIDYDIIVNEARVDKSLLKKYSVEFKIENGKTLIIEPQKISLDEIAMNHLFSEVFYYCNNLEISYCPLGGKGCEFSIDIKQYRG